MENLAVHMRIAGSNVSNEDVNTRKAAILDLSRTWQSGSVERLLGIAAGTAQSLHHETPCPDIGTEVEKAVQQHAAAFLYAESPFEVGIVAGMSLAEIAKVEPRPEAEWNTREVLSASVWSALSYQVPLAETKREALRLEVLGAAQKYVRLAAEASRARSTVADFNALAITLTAGKEATAAAGAAAEELPTASSNFAEATEATITALRRNAALDREELDFLWWTQVGRSRLLGKQLIALAEPVRLVVAGIEGAANLRRLPCETHRDIVLRTLDKDPELDLKKLLTALGAEREKIAAQYTNSRAAKWPTIFPLLNALVTGNSDGPAHAVKRSASVWGARALLEAGMVQYFEKGAAKL